MIAEPQLERWIPVDVSSWIRQTQGTEGESSVSLTPYDIPDAIRVSKDENGWVTFEFKYLTSNEPMAKAETDTELVEMRVGKKTGRIYLIRARTQQANQNVFSNQSGQIVQKALESLEQTESHDFGPRQRVKVIEGIVRIHGTATSSATVTPRLIKAPPEDQSQSE